MAPKKKRKFPTSIGDSLLSEERLKMIRPEEVVGAFGFREGESVVDLGCGPGAFLKALSEAVGEKGRVYAVDIQEPFINMAKRLAAEKGLRNIEFVVSREKAIPLEDDAADGALMVNVLHELDGNYTLRELIRILKKGAKLGVVEWEKAKSPMGPPLSERYSEEESEALLRENGFEIRRLFKVGTYHYAVEAHKPGSARKKAGKR
ncbi:MAG: class I SAM-dependent methyltransferase [Methanomassiliicoccales archaeon]